MGTFCNIHVHSAKSFLSDNCSPSNVSPNNAAVSKNEEEEKITDIAVTAAEVAAPDNIIVRAPDQQKSDNGTLFLPAQPVRDY